MYGADRLTLAPSFCLCTLADGFGGLEQQSTGAVWNAYGRASGRGPTYSKKPTLYENVYTERKKDGEKILSRSSIT